MNAPIRITPPAQDQTISIMPTQPVAVVDNETAHERAMKAHIGMGENSPGQENLRAAILAGREADYRRLAQGQAEVDFRRQKLQALDNITRNNEGPLSAEEQDFILGMSQTDFSTFVESPEAIWETEYGKAFVTKIASLSPDLTNEAISFDSVASLDFMDASSFVIARQEIARKLSEDIQAEIDQQSRGRYVAEFFGNVVPGLWWWRTQNVVKNAPSTSFLPGNNWKEQIEYLWSLPPSQFQRELKQALDSIPNKQTAKQFADAVMGFSTFDRTLNNIIGIADAADIATVAALPLAVPLAAVGTAVGRGARAARGSLRESGRVAREAAETALPKTIESDRGTYEVVIGPTGKSRPDGTPVSATVKHDEKKVILDRAEIEKQFEDKPWTKPRVEGVEPFPEDAFRTKEEWFEFVFLHEKAHLSHPRLPDETTAAYENRINRIAYNEFELSGPASGASINVTRATAGDAFEPLKATPLERFKKAVIDSFRAMVRPRADLGDALAGAGDVAGAARHDVLKDAVKGFDAADPLAQGRRLKSRLPSIFTPEQMSAGAKAFSREFTERLDWVLTRNAANILTALTRPGRAERLTPEALEAGFKAAEDELRRRFNHVNDRVLDVVPRRIQPEDNLAGIAAVSMRIGKPSGELFKSGKQAWHHAQALGLDDAMYTVRQQGQGFYIEVFKAVDETVDLVRGSLITTNNATPVNMVDTWLGALRSSQDTLSPHQSQNRLATVHGATEVQRLMKEVASDIGSLSKTERNHLRRILEKNRDYTDPISGDRGMFYDTLADFESAYLSEFGRIPTERETAAYFAFRQISDFDYMVRNLGLVRDKSRLGIEEVRYTFFRPDPELEGQYKQETMYFEGKKVNDIPWDNPEDAGIWIEGLDRLVKKNSPFAEDKQAIQRLINEKGYRVIQVANPDALPMAKRLGREDTVNFVLVQNPQFSPLRWDQLPYKPGGHVEYAASAYVKQPTIARVGDDPTSWTHHYRGDASILGFRTIAEAKKYAPKLDQARQLLKENRIDDLKKYLDDNLPWDFDDFKGMFEPRRGPDGLEQKALLSLDESIVAVQSGRNVLDELPDLATRYAGFRNDVRSSYNLYQNIDKKFAGERSGPLKTIMEDIGADHNPILSLANAPTIDPFASLEATTANVIRSRFLNDYKIGAIESWMAEFKDVLSEFKVPGGRQRIAADPVYYLHNALFDETADAARLAAARNSREAILSLIGTPNAVQTKLNHMTSKLMDTIYNKKGQKAVEFTQEHLLSREVDPLRFMRSVAFHTKLGLFNWQQFLVNSQSLTHIMGVAGPTNAMPSMAAATMMQFLRLNARPQMIDKMADAAQKMGYNRKDFIESFEELKRTGYWNIEGETAWKNVIDYSIVDGTGGKFLDWGTTFFKESERLVRVSAWNVAFREFRAANPTKAITNATRNEILRRADLLAVNMTRASNASWQNNIWSVPAQFLTYQIRLTEQFLGKRLTTGEKLRAVATYGAMYGLPATAAVVTGIPFYESMRKGALEKGWDMSNPMTHAVHEGLVSLLLKYVTGEDFALTQRYAPGGLPIFDVLESEDTLSAVIELGLGASGSIMHDIFKTFDPFLHSVTGIFRDDNERFPLKAGDFLEPLTNVSSVNNFTKMWWALNTGRFVTKNEIYIGDATPFQAIFNGITGLVPSEINDAFLMQKSVRDVAAAQRETEKLIVKNLRLAFAKMADGDDKGYEDYMQRARVYLVAGGFQPNQWGKILLEAAGGQNSLVNEARKRFIQRAPVDQAQPRFEAAVRDAER